jgi:hypothetical protein
LRETLAWLFALFLFTVTLALVIDVINRAANP